MLSQRGPEVSVRGKPAIIVMAYGSPSSLGDVERYLTHIRGGKKPRPWEVEELTNRYAAIGGKSPLLEITLSQAHALEEALTGRGLDWKVYIGMLHSSPFIEDTVRTMLSDGVQTIISLPLTPYHSALTTGKYENKIIETLRDAPHPARIIPVRGWYSHPKFINAWVQNIKSALKINGDSFLIFTAHSLPKKASDFIPPYPEQLDQTCNLIAESLNMKNWFLAYQSVGMAGGEWLGPELLDMLEELKNRGESNFLIIPVGFVSDHLEVLYDIDIECQEFARKHGIRIRRVQSLNTSPLFIDALASVVEENFRKAA